MSVFTAFQCMGPARHCSLSRADTFRWTAAWCARDSIVQTPRYCALFVTPKPAQIDISLKSHLYVLKKEKPENVVL